MDEQTKPTLVTGWQHAKHAASKLQPDASGRLFQVDIEAAKAHALVSIAMHLSEILEKMPDKEI